MPIARSATGLAVLLLAPVPSAAAAPTDARDCIAATGASPAACDRLLADPTTKRADRVAALFLRALHRIDTGDLAGAKADIDALVVADPDDALRWAAEATLLSKTGKPERALELHARAIGLSPRTAGLYVLRGMALGGLGRAADARRDFDEAVRLDPSLPVARLQRGLLLARVAELEAAIDDFDAALAGDPESRAARFGRAAALTGLARNDAALADLDRLLDGAMDDPMVVPSLWMRAAILRERKQFERALADLDRAVRLAPADVDVLQLRGLVYIARSDFERALADLDAAAAVDPNRGQTQLLRGLAL